MSSSWFTVLNSSSSNSGSSSFVQESGLLCILLEAHRPKGKVSSCYIPCRRMYTYAQHFVDPLSHSWHQYSTQCEGRGNFDKWRYSYLQLEKGTYCRKIYGIHYRVQSPKSSCFLQCKAGSNGPWGCIHGLIFWLKRYLDSQSAGSSGMGHSIYVTSRICGNIYTMYGNNYVAQ